MAQNSDEELKLLDPEQIAARRIPLEDSQLTLTQLKRWQCQYCNHRFTNELTFMKHHCEPKRRALELMSPTGIAAYGFYKEWMRLKKYGQPSSAAFMTSKFYRSFYRFAELVAQAGVSKPEVYIQLMIDAEIMPALWCRDQCYALYLDWMDRASDPIQQAQESIEFLISLCEKEDQNLSGILQHLGPQRVLSYIRQRRLSPWLLFCSATFGALLKTLDVEELKAFNAVVNSAYWAEKFSKNQKKIEEIKFAAKELGL